jgi:diacylglycerol O-acyltransferase / wax synthase
MASLRTGRGGPGLRAWLAFRAMSIAGGHLDRLTALDASFLTNETSASHMHIGGLLIFEGPPPPYLDLVDHVRGRLDLVPRFRQRLVVPPLEAGRPLWADDVNFNLKYHIRHTALPEPGGELELMRLAGRVFSQRLDRSKPLWEMWLVQGLERDRFAILTKTHHAAVDGVSGVDIGTVLFDLERDPEPRPVEDGWRPQPTPSAAQLVARGVSEVAGTPLRLAEGAIDAVRHPETAAQRVTEALEGLGEVVGAFADPAPNVPLNQPIGPHRRFVFVRSELATFKGIKDSLGGTVNDVVLAVVTGALRRWLQSRGVRTEGLELRALVPVSIRAEDERGELGNRLTTMRGPLPVYLEDPVRRLRVVTEQMEGVKRSKQALGAEVISRFNDFAPPTLLAQASRINFSTRLFNLIVTNVPGPQIPLYVLGREMEEVFPIAFLPVNHALAVAIMSYNGRVGFGLLADYDSMEDVMTVAVGLEQSLAELEEAADAARARRGG